MTVISRFQQTVKGAVEITGNVLGLAGDANGEGLLNFTVDTPAPPSGSTTTTWQNNSSAAFLNLPAGSTVLYAEVSWSGQFNSSISASLNTTVNFKTPLSSNIISPDPTTSQSITIPEGTFYGRSQNVTSLVSAGGAGFYSLGGVPGILSGGNDYLGWCLVVAFSNPSLPYRNLATWSMLQGVSGIGGSIDVPISNFVTPLMGNVTGRIVVSAGGGNSHISGDFLKFGATTSSLATLSGPNNSATNFFCSQINNGYPLSPNVGKIDTTGSFGTRNSIPPSRAVTGDRNSFDITNVDASPGLTNNQISGVIRFGTASDTYQPIALGMQIDVNAPNLSPIVKTVDKTFADIGDTLTYTITFTNNGVTDANNGIFLDTIPIGTSFIANSAIVNGVSSSENPAPPTGIFLGTIAVHQSMTISFKVLVNTIPSSNPLSNVSSIAYSFIPGTSLPQISAVENSNTITTLVNHVDLITVKSVDKAFADVNSNITYTIAIKNIGNTTAINVVFSDTIPNNTAFVANSVTVNNSPMSSVSPAPPGFILPVSISAGSTATVSFKVTVLCIPNPNPIPNTSTTSSSYVIDPNTSRTGSTSTNSGTVFTQVNNASISGITKSVDKAFSDCGDILTYTIVFPNSGNVTAQNILFKDTIPSGTVFVPNSVTLNNSPQTGANPQVGITIPNIVPGSSATISFKVQVIC